MNSFGKGEVDSSILSGSTRQAPELSRLFEATGSEKGVHVGPSEPAAGDGTPTPVTSPVTVPEAFYLIRRHGGWFRPAAAGYTQHLGEAGMFPEAVAYGYLHAEGVSIHPIRSMLGDIEAEIVRLRASLARLEAFKAACDVQEPRP